MRFYCKQINSTGAGVRQHPSGVKCRVVAVQGHKRGYWDSGGGESRGDQVSDILWQLPGGYFSPALLLMPSQPSVKTPEVPLAGSPQSESDLQRSVLTAALTRLCGCCMEAHCECCLHAGLAPPHLPARYIMVDHAHRLAGLPVLPILMRLREMTGAGAVFTVSRRKSQQPLLVPSVRLPFVMGPPSVTIRI